MGSDLTRGGPTLNQLLTLAWAADLENETWASVAAKLGTDKHSAMKVVQRLEEALGGAKILGELEDHVTFNKTEASLKILKLARSIRSSYERIMQASADLTGRPLHIRCRTYPGYVRNFLADAIGSFEGRFATESADGTSVRIDLRDVDNQFRGGGGAGLLHGLLDDPRTLDVVFAPWNDRVKSVASMKLYRWSLLAFMSETHPLNSKKHAPITLSDLTGCELMTSPVGHRSHKMLVDAAAPEYTLNLGLQTPQTATRIALAQATHRVAVVPSDAVDPEELHRSSWRPITEARSERDEPKPISAIAAIYWPRWTESDRAHTPSEVTAAIDSFVQHVVGAAEAYTHETQGTVEFLGEGPPRS